MNNKTFLKSLNKNEKNNLKFAKQMGVYKEALQFLKCSLQECKKHNEELSKIKQECLKSKDYTCYYEKAIKPKNGPFVKQQQCLKKNCDKLKKRLDAKSDAKFRKMQSLKTKKNNKNKQKKTNKKTNKKN